jgi:UDP-N-acetylglucosamine:LPS N-acetylglucosamine transferase
LLREVSPQAVVGFGGYPDGAPDRRRPARRIARSCCTSRTPSLGQANKVLIRLGAILATGFDRPNGSGRARERVHVGNPGAPGHRRRDPALPAAGRRRAVPAAGVRRQPGRAGLFRAGAGCAGDAA